MSQYFMLLKSSNSGNDKALWIFVQSKRCCWSSTFLVRLHFREHERLFLIIEGVLALTPLTEFDLNAKSNSHSLLDKSGQFRYSCNYNLLYDICFTLMWLSCSLLNYANATFLISLLICFLNSFLDNKNKLQYVTK